MAGSSLHVVLSSLGGDELCTVDVPGNSKASELKDFMARELQVSPYTFKLITVGSGLPVEGNGVRVESLAESGRIDLTMVKIDGIPTPDSQGYLQLQSKGDGSPRSDAARRSRLTATVAILLFTALVAGFFHFPYGLLVWYVVYLVEALFFNPTAKGLMRLKQTECILDYIDDIKACRPAPEIKAQCYHMETRTRHTTNQDGTTRTETYSERVDTASFTERLMVAQWDDITGNVVDGLSYFPLLHVHFEIQWEAGDAETHRSHERQRQALKARAAAADVSHDMSEELRLIDEQGQECPFYTDMIGTTGDSFPMWLGYLPYAICCILCLSWPYRYCLAQRAVKGDFIFEKRVWSRAGPAAI